MSYVHLMEELEPHFYSSDVFFFRKFYHNLRSTMSEAATRAKKPFGNASGALFLIRFDMRHKQRQTNTREYLMVSHRTVDGGRLAATWDFALIPHTKCFCVFISNSKSTTQHETTETQFTEIKKKFLRHTFLNFNERPCGSGTFLAGQLHFETSACSWGV